MFLKNRISHKLWKICYIEIYQKLLEDILVANNNDQL
jgi:ATP adenylyltransferase/5',5'''-P-1,P-4-tetraphosphate phosphorylase II